MWEREETWESWVDVPPLGWRWSGGEVVTGMGVEGEYEVGRLSINTALAANLA